jgi:phosphohistidine swiveling domain-containing protein
LQERVLDVRDVCYQLLQQIYGEQRFPAPGQLTQPTVCLADDLTPGQFLELDKTLLKGLLLKSGGTTSHTVILARSFNIPTLVGVDSESLLQWRNQPVFIDGNAGAVVVNASDAVARYYRQEARVQQAYASSKASGLTGKPEPPTACALRLPPTLPMRWKRRQHSGTAPKALACFAPKCCIWIAPARPVKTSCTTFSVRRWKVQTGAALSCAPWISAAINRWIT